MRDTVSVSVSSSKSCVPLPCVCAAAAPAAAKRACSCLRRNSRCWRRMSSICIATHVHHHSVSGVCDVDRPAACHTHGPSFVAHSLTAVTLPAVASRTGSSSGEQE